MRLESYSDMFVHWLHMADLWCIISADELSSHVAPRLKYSSVCNSSSEVNWSGGMLWCLNGRVCCFLLGGQPIIVGV